MNNYDKIASIIVEAIGGQENIIDLNHCVTRLRFKLADNKKCEIDKIKQIELVKGVVQQSNQFQIIIGNEVGEFYEAINKKFKINPSAQPILKRTWWQEGLSQISEIFAPLIPVIIGSGLLQGIVEWAKVCDNELLFFEQITTSIFSYLPIGIIYTIFKKNKGNEVLGIFGGILLVVVFNHYQSSILPSLFLGFMMVSIEKYFKKIIPQSLAIIFVPIFTLTLPLLILNIGIGEALLWIEQLIAHCLYQLLTFKYAWIIGGLIGLSYGFCIKTGLHHLSLLFDLILILVYHKTLLWPILVLSNISQGTASLMMKRYEPSLQTTFKQAAVSAYFGVSEPALFGVNLKYRMPFYWGVIGAMIGGMMCLLFQVEALSVGVGGFLGILSISPQTVVYFIASIICSILITILMSMIFKCDKVTESFIIPAKGEIIPLVKVEDEVFSSGMMGEGFAIDLKKGRIVAPLSGEVTVKFPTGHAYGIKTNDGIEVLIHIGMDTVSLQGKGFKSYVNVGDHVQSGDVICEVDLDYLKQQGKSTITPVIVTSCHHLVLENNQVKITKK